MKLYAAILALLWTTLGISQDNTDLLSSTYGIVNFGEEDGTYYSDDGYIDEEGNHIVLYQNSGTVGIAFFNKQFDMQWSKEIGTNTSFGTGQLLRLSDGSYFAISGLQMLSFTKTGKIHWQKSLPEGSYQARSCAEMSNGNIVVSGQYSYQSFIVIYQPDGTLVKSFSSKSIITDVSPSSDGNMLLLGVLNTNQSPYQENGIVLAKVKPDGTWLWEKIMTYDNENDVHTYNRIIESKTGELYVTGRTLKKNNANFNTSDLLVIKFDHGGNYLKGNTYGFVYDDSGYDLIEDQEGNIIVTGFSMTTRSCGGSLFVLRLCPELEVIYTKNFGESSASGAFYKQLHKKGDMIYAFGSGSLFSSISDLGADAHLIKTDLNFSFHCVNYYKEISVKSSPEYKLIEHKSQFGFGTYLIHEQQNEQSGNMIKAEVFCAPKSIAESIPEKTPCSQNPLNTPSIEQGGMAIFPNPTSHMLRIDLTKEVTHTELHILDITGQLVHRQTLNSTNSVSIDLAHLPKGTYTIQVQMPEALQTARFIKL